MGANRSRIFEVVLTCAVVISLALAVQAVAVKPFQIPSGSMQPTLEIGERVLVERFSTNFGADPKIGDVIVFHPPLAAVPDEQEGGQELSKCGVPYEELGDEKACPLPGEEEADAHFIKRVVAEPGDTLKILEGVPIVNGERVEGDWQTIPCGQGECDFPREITIPEDHFFVMGDNRPGSDDSRFWGPVPRDWIVGKAVLTYWPPSRAGDI